MTSKRIRIIGVPFDLGASSRGSAGGPAAIRRTELGRHLQEMGLAAEDWGDVSMPAAADASAKAGGRMKHLPAVLKACREVSKAAYEAVRSGWVPVFLGGDHSMAMGSVAGVARRYHESKKAIGLLWVDAHADINTPQTSPSGNIHGMPLAHLLGLGDARLRQLAGFAPAVNPARTCLVGIRDVDRGEREHLARLGVRVFTMSEIDRHGMARVAEEAVGVAGEQTAGIHVSFDIDAADPSIAQGTGTKKRGGLTYREAHLLMEIVAEMGRLVSLDMVEVNPLEDIHNTTAELACELILSALGKRIY